MRISMSLRRFTGLLITALAFAPAGSAGAGEPCPESAEMSARLAEAGQEPGRVLRVLRHTVAAMNCASLDAMKELQRRREDVLAKEFPYVSPADLERGPDSRGGKYPYAMALWKKGRTDLVVPAAVLEAKYLSMGAEQLLWRLYTLGLSDAAAPFDPRILATFRELADDHISRGEYFIGRILRRGIGQPADPAGAERWLVRAAERLADAKVELGLLRLDQRRYRDALSLMEAALREEPGNGAAVGGMGAVLAQAPAPIGDCGRARELLLRAGKELHDEDALFLLAVAGADRNGPLACLKVESDEVRSNLEAAAARGHPGARALLARSARTEVTPATSETWKEGCATSARSMDCYNYGVHLAQTVHDEPAAIPYFEKACAGGTQVACFNLAGLLIKAKATRERGIGYFQSVCSAGQAASEPPGLRDAACRFGELVRKYKDLDYSDLSRKLTK
jgi:TPR repeat protein